MQHVILNNTDEYLLLQRGRNNRDIARALRKYLRYYLIRDQIPLDGVMYPDYLSHDLKQMQLIGHRILAQLENETLGYPNMKQLELSFGDDI